jgi:hypothetical protein
VKKTFKKSDIIDQDKLNKDIEETFDRLKNNPKNFKRRTPEQVYEDTVLGLVLEYYLIQNDPKYRKAIDLNPTDYYHDLIDTETGEIHECKVTRSYMGWESFYVQNRIKRIITEGWNHSKYMHVATYNNKTGVYIYQGIKQIVNDKK